MRRVSRLILGAAACALLTGSAQPASAKPEYTRKTTKGCPFCHQPPGYNLNDAGKYYAGHRYSLKGYTPPPKEKPKPSH